MNERTQREIEETLDVLRPIGFGLLERGYDANIWVEQHEDHITVELRIRIPPLGVPVGANNGQW